MAQVSKESACNAGDPGSVPVLGRTPGEGNGNPLQCSCLENPINRGAWWAIVLGITKNGTRTERLTHAYRKTVRCFMQRGGSTKTQKQDMTLDIGGKINTVTVV